MLDLKYVCDTVRCLKFSTNELRSRPTLASRARELRLRATEEKSRSNQKKQGSERVTSTSRAHSVAELAAVLVKRLIK